LLRFGWETTMRLETRQIVITWRVLSDYDKNN
jgi:hypothetical protein